MEAFMRNGEMNLNENDVAWSSSLIAYGHY